MKNKKIFFVLVFIIGILTLSFHCKGDDDSSPSTIIDIPSQFANGTIPLSATFWSISLIDAENPYYLVTATKWGEGTYCILYVETYPTDQRSAMARFTESQVEVFDDIVYPKITQNFAYPPDRDSNNKVIILYTNIQDGYSPSYINSFVGGFFYYYNEYKPTEINNNHTNQCDMLYLDTYPGTVSSANREQIKMTLAHEFQHMVNYNAKHFIKNTESVETWIDEGLSENASHFAFETENTSRITYFIGDYNDYFKKGKISLVNWNDLNSSSEKVLCNYSLSYLFFNYLWSQSGSNSDCSIFKTIIEDDDISIKAVRDAVQTKINKSLEEVYSNFLVALQLNTKSTSTGIYSFNGLINDVITPPTGTCISSVPLEPYAFVYLKYNNSALTPVGTWGQNILYTGVNGLYNVDLSSPYDVSSNVSDGYLIAWNSSSIWSDGNFPTQDSGPNVLSSSSKSYKEIDLNNNSSEEPKVLTINPYELVRKINNKK